MIVKLLYLLYFCKTTKYSRLYSDLSYVSNYKQLSKLKIILDILASSYIFGSSFHEYFYYSFFDKSKNERAQYATTVYMYKYQKKHNPPSTRSLFSNKISFYNNYSDFIKRNWFQISLANINSIIEFLNDKDKVVIKGSLGKAGNKVEIVDLKTTSSSNLIKYALKNKFDLIEEYIYQHPSLMDLSPNSLNTIRIITQYDHINSSIYFLGAILRLGIYENTDNLSTGGIAAEINLSTGIVETTGISFGLPPMNYTHHPVSKLNIKGFLIPFWSDILDLTKQAALHNTNNTSIGWDIAITSNGPLIIEANHDWGARLWQMPGQKGLKHELEQYV